MKRETAKLIEQAQICIARGEIMLTVDLNEDAGRAAYLACLHAAEALIFEDTDKVARSHRGVQTEFFRLTRHDGRFDSDLRRFLSQAYEFKSVADYFTGDGGGVSPERAADAIASAKRFLDQVVKLLPT